MPHLTFRGLEKKALIENSKQLIDELTEIIGCDRTWFTLEHRETEFIFDGNIIPGFTFVDMAWFDRGQEVQDKVAIAITNFCKSINGGKDTTVVFTLLKENTYYENGAHF